MTTAELNRMAHLSGRPDRDTNAEYLTLRLKHLTEKYNRLEEYVAEHAECTCAPNAPLDPCPACMAEMIVSHSRHIEHEHYGHELAIQ